MFGCSHAGAGSYTDEEHLSQDVAGSQDLLQSSWLSQILVSFSLPYEVMRNLFMTFLESLYVKVKPLFRFMQVNLFFFCKILPGQFCAFALLSTFEQTHFLVIISCFVNILWSSVSATPSFISNIQAVVRNHLKGMSRSLGGAGINPAGWVCFVNAADLKTCCSRQLFAQVFVLPAQMGGVNINRFV